jgi:predicted dehydrogenase
LGDEVSQAKDKVRVVVVGAGGRGEYIASLVRSRSDAEVVAIVDRIPQKAEWLAKRLDLSQAHIFQSVEDIPASLSFDAGMVCAPDGQHADVAIPLIKRGKRVFCEKPLDITARKCRAFIRADEKAGGKTFVGFNLRHAPFYATVKRLIEAGEIGRILTVQADEFYDGGRTYFRRWNGLRAESGGLWITKASHDFDLLAWLTAARPVEVYAHAAKTYYVPKAEAAAQCRACSLADQCPDRAAKIPSDLLAITEANGGRPHDLCLYNTPSDTFDHGIAQVRFEGDIFATYTCNVVTGFTDRRLRVGGTKGTLDGHLGGATVTFIRRDPSETKDIPVQSDAAGGHGGSDPLMVEKFIAFAGGFAPPACTPREASVAVCMGLAATLSSDKGKPVPVEAIK